MKTGVERMKTKALPVAAAAYAAGLCGADVVVDDGETVDLAVEADAVQEEPVWFAAEAGKLEKSGAGAYTFVASNLVSSAPAVVAVREGALSFVAGEAGEAPAPRAVRLRLRGTTAAWTADVPCVVVDELVANGTFADASSWTLRGNKDSSTAVFAASTAKCSASVGDPCGVVTFGSGEPVQAFGNTYGVGKKALGLVQCASAEQQVAFPAAGTYRLMFSARSRLWINADGTAPSRGYGGNQGQFYLVDAQGVTNEIFRTPSLYASNFVFRSALFNVPAAGTYTFGVRGLNGMPQPDGTALKVVDNADNDAELFVDQVSVTPAGGAALELDEGLELDLRGAAALRLDFAGTNEGARLRLGGVSVSGYVDASHPSGLVRGTGCLFIRPKGTVFLLR